MLQSQRRMQVLILYLGIQLRIRYMTFAVFHTAVGYNRQCLVELLQAALVH